MTHLADLPRMERANGASDTAALLSWLDARTPAPPASLRARLHVLVGERAAEREGALAPRDATMADALIATAEWLLARLLHDGQLTRGRAIDLLAADALITYAFEASSDEPTALEARAAGAMARLSALVA